MMNDLISRQAAIDVASGYCHPANIAEELAKLPSAQPEPSQIARDIATIIENEQDMRVLLRPKPHYDEWCTDCSEYDKDKHCCPRFNRVIRSAVDDAQRWIPVTERLPEDDTLMLVNYIDHRPDAMDIWIGWHEMENVWYIDGEEHSCERGNEVVAWMPLPEPYREDGDNDE